jgi:hypothetical protein
MDQTSTCTHCGKIHAGRCPLVKAIEYHENGIVKRVEYFPIKPEATIDFARTLDVFFNGRRA